MYKIHYSEVAKGIIQSRHSFETIEGMIRSEISELMYSGLESPGHLVFHTIFPPNSDDEFIIYPTGEGDDLMVEVSETIEIEIEDGPFAGMKLIMPDLDDV